MSFGVTPGLLQGLSSDSECDAMPHVTPSGVVQFIESFHGQSSTGGEDRPSRCAALLSLLDKLDDRTFPDVASYAAMRSEYSRLYIYVERHKENPSAAADNYTNMLSRGINPIRNIWDLMKTLSESPSPHVRPGSVDAQSSARMYEHILLEAEPIELLAILVEASRNVPSDQREKFLVAKTLQGSTLLHPGLPEQRDIYYGDVEALASAGLVMLTYTGDSTPLFDVTSLGFRYYAHLKEGVGTPIQTIESEIRRYIDGRQMSSQHPISLSKWREAEELLWGADSESQFTTIGHLCREAIQEFAQELARRLEVTIDDASKAKTVATMRAVLNARRPTLGDSHAAFLDALLSYWGTVSDLIQRQEHGADKAGTPLKWEDGRRVVFQTLLVIYEFSRSLI
jgi:hypothetical protein